MQLVVQKFGGTSVGSIERIRNVARLVAESSQKERCVVVVSAMAGQTNKLVELAMQISDRPNKEAYDMLLASGEQVSSALLAMALDELGFPATPLLGFQAGIETTELFTRARILRMDTQLIEQVLSESRIPVIAGFQGVTRASGSTKITTLGRGGSDTSAVAIAVALKAARCDIYTDVDGVYTADPRLVPKARRIPNMCFDEMMELASLGAKVLHMRSVELAAKYKMPLRVLSTFAPEQGGTVFQSESLESPVVSAITSDSAEALLTLRMSEAAAYFPNLYFKPLAEAGINVDVIVRSVADDQGQASISFTVPRDQGTHALELLRKSFPTDDALLRPGSVVKVSIVGIGMRTHSGVAAKMFDVLAANKIPVHLITTSEIKISVLLDEKDKALAVQKLHDAFELGSP
jgi:aspartate kinase